MERNGILDERPRPCARGAADDGRIETQQRIALQALQDMSRLTEAGEVDVAASGTVVAALQAIPLRAAAPAGSQGVAVAHDITAGTVAVAALDDLDVSMAGVMVRAAVALETAFPMRRDAPSGQEDRP